MTITVEATRHSVPTGPAGFPAYPAAPRTLAPDPLEDITEHLRLHHGRDVLELVGTWDHQHAIHRFEHFESSVGLVLVDHTH